MGNVGTEMVKWVNTKLPEICWLYFDQYLLLYSPTIITKDKWIIIVLAVLTMSDLLLSKWLIGTGNNSLIVSHNGSTGKSAQYLIYLIDAVRKIKLIVIIFIGLKLKQQVLNHITQQM